MPRLSRVLAANVAVTNNGAPVATWTYIGSQQITSGSNHRPMPCPAGTSR
ncbi:hypothetical protein [Saccharothrix stipae]